MIYADNTKICRVCKKQRDISLFAKDSRSKDGYNSKCKYCFGVKNPNRVRKDASAKYIKAQYDKYYKDGKKMCATCNKLLPIGAFAPRAGTYDKLCKTCNDCYGKDRKQPDLQAKYQNSTDAEKSYISIYGSAKRRGKEFSLTRQQFIQWYNTSTDECHYCKITGPEYSGVMSKLKSLGKAANGIGTVASQVRYSPRLTIDRKDNEKGYTIDNICKSCWFCNVTKGSLLSEEIMIEVGKEIKSKLVHYCS